MYLVGVEASRYMIIIRTPRPKGAAFLLGGVEKIENITENE
jgi:hypothetical protein